MREILFRGQTRRKGEYCINMRYDKCDSNWAYGGIFPQNGGSDRAIIYQQKPTVEKRIVYADTELTIPKGTIVAVYRYY